jgi:glycosyltransferase involved in cell wall biosynthesis
MALPDSSLNHDWPKISIVTPSFNQAAFIEETLRSVLMQGYSNLEYIVIDGASTDGSAEVIRAYQDSLTYWHSEPDRGQSDALNKGLSRCTGDILAWLNSDDRYAEGALAHVATLFGEHPDIDFVYGDCELMDVQGRSRGRMWPPQEFSLETLLIEGSVVPQPTCFWRRRAFERLGPLREDLQLMMDQEYWRRAALAGFRFLRTDRVLAQFRSHGTQKTTAMARRWLGEHRRLFEEELGHPAFARSKSFRARKTGALLRFQAKIEAREGNHRAATVSALTAIPKAVRGRRLADCIAAAKLLLRVGLRQIR